MENYIKNKWYLEDILTIQYLNNLDIKKIHYIIEKYDSIDELIRLKSEFQDELFGNAVTKARDEAKRQIELCNKESIRIITFWDSEYPRLLKEIQSAPTVLYIKGTLQSSDAISISIVGTRKNTSYGALCTELFAEFFAKNGIIITSGLADGIDRIAHKSALNAKGFTYAVLGSSLDKIYPVSSERIFHQIYESGGAIISEYKLGTITRPQYFVQRNRIISGISKATIIVESKKKGGALITADFAFEQDRELYAIPGKINSPTSEGTNYLIHLNKAKLIQNPEQVLLDLNFSFQNSTRIISSQNAKFDDKNEQLIYDVINDEPIHIDTIVEKTQLDISEVLVKLLNMEFNGFVKQIPGKYYIKK